jgi:pimeloyl-ACP methyl ester carboxylesterase
VLFLTCQQGFAEVDGAQLYYEITESGPPLELLHGFTLDSRTWPPISLYLISTTKLGIIF